MRSSSIRFSLTLISFFLCVGLFEIGARFLLKPCEGCYGRLLGRELPPFDLKAKNVTRPDDGDRVWQTTDLDYPPGVTRGDLLGVLREDNYIGYTAAENARSVKAWWVSNNIGARSRVRTETQIPKGKKRLLIFGESYGAGCRVPQDSTWFELLQKAEPQTEIVNMAVNGYSMGQAYLRYLTVRDQIAWSSVLFVFVPETDLWREINTHRFLGEGWRVNLIMPRFGLDGDGLKLIPSPNSDINGQDGQNFSPQVIDHLRRYDRFYFPILYEHSWVLDHFILYRLIARAVGHYQLMRTYEEAKVDLNSEALGIDRRIFKLVRLDSEKLGRRSVIALLPDPNLVDEIRLNPKSERLLRWNERAQLLKSDGLSVIDLMPFMLDLPQTKLDRGFDQTHYGVKTNQALSENLNARLRDMGIF